MREVIIYTLSDGLDVKYVGKTISPESRMYIHIYDAKTKSKLNKKDEWVKSLLDNGKKPIMEIVDIVTEDDWVFWEKYWINQFKVWGFELKNMTNGGGCTYRKPISDKTKRKMSLSKKGLIPKNIEQLKKSRVKPIIQYDVEGNELKIWESMNDARRNLSINNINLSANGKRCTAGGYIWRYIDNPLTKNDLRIIKDKLEKQIPKKILQLDKNGNLISRWESVNEVKRTYKHINAVLRGDRKSAGGYLWKYEKNSE